MRTLGRLALGGTAVTLTLVALTGCGNPSGTGAAQAAGGVGPSPLVTEVNPAGDIPDNQAYVPFVGKGFSIKVPEGWAQTTTAATTSFTDKLNRIEITASSASSGMTSQHAQSILDGMAASVPKFAAGKIATATRGGMPVTVLTYQGDSSPDPVTGKVVRDAFQRFIFVRNGVRVDVTLVGPTTADNVDPWRTVSDSFRWAA